MAPEEDVDVPEHERLTEQARMIASEISDRIIPRVVQLDSSLGHTLDDAFQQFVTLHRQLALLAKQQYIRAENAQANAIKAQAEAEERRLEALRSNGERDIAVSAKAACDSKALRLEREARESTLQLQAMTKERELEKDFLHEARTAAHEAQLSRTIKSTPAIGT